jgi:two-component system sporulation sensor kinase A
MPQPSLDRVVGRFFSALGSKAFALPFSRISAFPSGMYRGRKPTGIAIPSGGSDQALACLLHEIRNYSATVRGGIGLLRREYPSDGMMAPLGRMERALNKIDSLSHQVLRAASLNGAADLRRIDIVDLIKGCIEDHFPERKPLFRLETVGEIPDLCGDFPKLERVFLNLFRNALEAGATAVLVHVSPSPAGLRILVEDNGCGAGKEQLERMFEPLFSTRKAAGGTGLGLFIVKAIIDSHKGSIHAASKDGSGPFGSGMVFSLELPRAQ